MSLKPLNWNGDIYSLSIRRHWNTFFGLATVFEINVPRIYKILPAGTGYHIISIHSLCQSSKKYFNSTDNWWRFSKLLCDQFCEYLVMEKTEVSNIFSIFHSHDCNDRYAVQNFAKKSKGYIGPEKWDKAQLVGFNQNSQ